MTPPVWTGFTAGPKQTRRIGRWLGQAAKIPVVITLDGDLGAGKTVLVQGIAEGLAVDPDTYVASPTYTLVAIYPGRLPLIHADLYRLNPPVDPEALGLELECPDGVVAVEWAGRLDASYLGDHLNIAVHMAANDRRRLTLTAYGLGPTLLIDKIAARAAAAQTTDPTDPQKQ